MNQTSCTTSSASSGRHSQWSCAFSARTYPSCPGRATQLQKHSAVKRHEVFLGPEGEMLKILSARRQLLPWVRPTSSSSTSRPNFRQMRRIKRARVNSSPKGKRVPPLSKKHGLEEHRAPLSLTASADRLRRGEDRKSCPEPNRDLPEAHRASPSGLRVTGAMTAKNGVLLQSNFDGVPFTLTTSAPQRGYVRRCQEVRAFGKAVILNPPNSPRF